jgi:hypothetical protein
MNRLFINCNTKSFRKMGVQGQGESGKKKKGAEAPFTNQKVLTYAAGAITTRFASARPSSKSG